MPKGCLVSEVLRRRGKISLNVILSGRAASSQWYQTGHKTQKKKMYSGTWTWMIERDKIQPSCGPLNVSFYCLPAAWHLFKKGLLTLSQYWKIRRCLPKTRLCILLADNVTVTWGHVSCFKTLLGFCLGRCSNGQSSCT